MKGYSQLYQDVLVLDLLGYKSGGTFVDIGCGPPVDINNTFLMESEYDWRGVSIDFNQEEKVKWISDRPNSSIIIADALTLDFNELFLQYNLPNTIDYLSFDLDPPTVTFQAFQRFPHDEYKFNVITYEHDGYRMGEDFKNKTRDFIKSKGYVFVQEFNNQDDLYMSEEFFNNKIAEDNNE